MKSRRKTNPFTHSHAVVIINNHTVCVEREVAEEIARLRNAVRMARNFLQDCPETTPARAKEGVF